MQQGECSDRASDSSAMILKKKGNLILWMR